MAVTLRSNIWGTVLVKEVSIRNFHPSTPDFSGMNLASPMVNAQIKITIQIGQGFNWSKGWKLM